MSLTCYYVTDAPGCNAHVCYGLRAQSWIYCEYIQPVYRRRGIGTQAMPKVRLVEPLT